MNQRDATCNTLIAVLQEREVEYELNGATSIASVLTTEDKKKAREVLHAMFLNKQIDFKDSSKLSDEKYMKDYISGLVNNWIRKAPEFNGSTKYQAKNPGSRQGSQDEMIKELKKLLTIVEPENKAAIQEAIDQRLATIKPTKVVTINVAALPEHLRSLVK